MRQKRSKVYRRLVHQYVVHYGFREPFQVLLDDSFAEALGRYKVGDPLRQLGNVLQAKVKPMITQCCMVALYNAEARASALYSATMQHWVIMGFTLACSTLPSWRSGSPTL